MQGNTKEAGKALATLTSLPIRPLGSAGSWHKHVTLVNFWISIDSPFALHAQREVCIPLDNLPSMYHQGRGAMWQYPLNLNWQNLLIKTEMKNTAFLNN